LLSIVRLQAKAKDRMACLCLISPVFSQSALLFLPRAATGRFDPFAGPPKDDNCLRIAAVYCAGSGRQAGRP
jgi:hypothetical protein